MCFAQIYASINAQIPIKTSIKTLTFVAVLSIQSFWKNRLFSLAFANTRASAIAPLAVAAPSVLTASPIQAPATSGSFQRNCCAKNGRIKSSTTAKMTTSEDTIIGTTGRAFIAAPVAIAALTPQIEIPEARGAAHSRLNLKYLRATK